MNMVKFGNNLDPDKEFDVLHSILDFPMECLEECDDAEDWDVSNPECLGPIPSNVLMGPPMMSDEMFNFQRPNLFPQPVSPMSGLLDLKKPPKHVDTLALRTPPLRKFPKVQESPSCCIQSPVSVLESSGSHPRERSFSIEFGNVIPVRSRSKRVRYAGINPWVLAAHGLSTSKQTPNASKSRESRKMLSQKPVHMDLLKNSPRNVDSSLDVSDPTHLQYTSKKCSHCQSTKTPQWRWGPLGRNTLCNACGVRYRSGRLFPEYRPAGSPTFTQSQHSNSHRKVTEMRNKANLSTAKIKIEIVRAPQRKQLSEHVDTSLPITSPQIVGSPKQMKLANHNDTHCSHFPSQNNQANAEDSCAFCAGTHVSVLENSVSCSRERRLSSISSRSKHIKPALANPSPLSLPSTCTKTSNTIKCEENSKQSFQLPVATDAPKDDESSLHVPDASSPQNAPKSGNNRTKKCAHCQSTKTPQWREGPLGPRTLCNACGVRYRSGRLVPEYRPAASPTFVPSKHSNLHSKVVQMIKAEHASLRPGVEIKVPLTSPQPEFVP